MDKDDIISIAQAAHFHLDNIDLEFKKYQRFAHLVSMYERESCARLCDKETNPNADKTVPVSQYQSGCYITAEYLAAAIRARGQ